MQAKESSKFALVIDTATRPSDRLELLSLPLASQEPWSRHASSLFHASHVIGPTRAFPLKRRATNAMKHQQGFGDDDCRIFSNHR